MMRSGSANGSPRISTALTSVKTVLLTPMPSASAVAATAVNHLSLISRRTANRTSCQRPTARSNQMRGLLDTHYVPTDRAVHNARRAIYGLGMSDSEGARRDGTSPLSQSLTFPAHGGSGSHASKYRTIVVSTISE